MTPPTMVELTDDQCTILGLRGEVTDLNGTIDRLKARIDLARTYLRGNNPLRVILALQALDGTLQATLEEVRRVLGDVKVEL